MAILSIFPLFFSLLAELCVYYRVLAGQLFLLLLFIWLWVFVCFLEEEKMRVGGNPLFITANYKR